jgi:hypothetical protein
LIDNALANATGTPSESAIGRATQGFANLSDGTPPVFLQGKDIAENWGSLQSAISVKRGSKRTAGAALTATGDSDRSLEPTLTESASDAAIAEIFQDWPTARREAEGGLS